jgi:hypothetical protein
MNGIYSAYRPASKRTKPKRKRLFIVLALLLLGAFLVVLFKKMNTSSNSAPTQTVQQKRVESSNYVAVKGRYLFSGTVVIARAVENEARTANGIDYDQPFIQFHTFQPGQYDAWEFDHECPMTTENIPYRTQVENTIFNCRPEFIPAMKKQFSTIIANVANNHTRDMGDDGFDETVELLEKGGIQTIGNHDPREKEDICQAVALPVRLEKKDGGEEKGTLPIAFCAWHYFEQDPEPDQIEVMNRYAKVMPVFAFVQVGVEYRDHADEKQKDIARRLIDNGSPEFVIENSPHWVQETEAYKGKLVVYSTGNFIFDQLDEETNRGISIDAIMTTPYNDNVATWLALGEQCRARNDTCLETAEQQKLQKIDVELNYTLVGSSTGYREVTKKADNALQKALEQRTNWQKTLQDLGQL